MKNLLKAFIPIIAVFLLAFGVTQAVTIFTVPQGGSGVGTITGIIKGNGTAPFSAATGADIPAAGSDTQVQYNDSGKLGADANFTFDKTAFSSTGLLSVNNIKSVGGDLVTSSLSEDTTLILQNDGSTYLRGTNEVKVENTNNGNALTLTDGGYTELNSHNGESLYFNNDSEAQLTLGGDSHILLRTSGGEDLQILNDNYGNEINVKGDGGTSITSQNGSLLELHDNNADSYIRLDGQGGINISANNGESDLVIEHRNNNNSFTLFNDGHVETYSRNGGDYLISNGNSTDMTLGGDGAITFNTSSSKNFVVNSDNNVVFNTPNLGQALFLDGSNSEIHIAHSGIGNLYIDAGQTFITQFSGGAGVQKVLFVNDSDGGIGTTGSVPTSQGGTGQTSWTSGSVPFINGSGNFDQDNPSFTYDSSANKLTIRNDTLGVTPQDSLLLTNNTPATVGAQQISPALHFSGRGWKTASTAASQPVDIRNYIVPVQGTNNPTGYLLWDSSVNGASYSNMMALTTGGSLGLGTVSPTGLLGIGSASQFSVNSSGAITAVAGIAITDATNISLATGTGTKIGTATTQKLGFFNSTPVIQQTGNIVTALSNLGLVVSGSLPAASITGTLGVANGGSGLTSLTANYIPYGNGTGAFASSANLQYTSGAGFLVNNNAQITGALQIGTNTFLSDGNFYTTASNDISLNPSGGFNVDTDNSGSINLQGDGGIHLSTDGNDIHIDGGDGGHLYLNTDGSTELTSTNNLEIKLDGKVNMTKSVRLPWRLANPFATIDTVDENTDYEIEWNSSTSFGIEDLPDATSDNQGLIIVVTNVSGSGGNITVTTLGGVQPILNDGSVATDIKEGNSMTFHSAGDHWTNN